MIHVCGLAALPSLTSELEPGHMISLLGDDPFPETPDSVVMVQTVKMQATGSSDSTS